MPFPAMRDTEDDYAQVQGVTVWEGDVGTLPPADKKGAAQEIAHGEKYRWIFHGDDGWDVVYQGQAPVAYVRTPIQNPILGLTASITLRDTPARKRTHKSTMSVESVASEATYKEENNGYEAQDEARIDLLGGLGGGESDFPACCHELIFSHGHYACHSAWKQYGPRPLYTSALTPFRAAFVCSDSRIVHHGSHTIIRPVSPLPTPSRPSAPPARRIAARQHLAQII
jgi:hypothetical protein